jgi:phage terminase Nu1 subunit (DNA packaging protein)
MAGPTRQRAKRSRSPAKPSKDVREGLSQEDVAERVPCAQATVSRFKRRGLLTELPNGRLDECAVDECRALLSEHDEQGETDPDLKRRLDSAMARLREAQAQLREIELEHERGRYVELAVVERDGQDTAERVLAVLRALPQRTALALECACRRAAVVEKVISEEVERAIAEMRESMYIRPEEK